MFWPADRNYSARSGCKKRHKNYFQWLHEQSNAKTTTIVRWKLIEKHKGTTHQVGPLE